MRLNMINDYIVLSFSRRLLDLRQKANLKQREVAEKIGISTVNYSRYEKGVITPTMDIIIPLAKAFDVSPAWLAFGAAGIAEKLLPDERYIMDCYRFIDDRGRTSIKRLLASELNNSIKDNSNS